MVERIKLWKPPYPLRRHVYSYGIIGGGKTCKSLAICQNYYEKGYKVFDIYGGKRGEGLFWCLPNDDEGLWNQLQRETYELSESGPKQYEVNILYPMFKSKLPKKLPFDKERGIKSIVFTIPFKEIRQEDLQFVLGSSATTGTATFLWESIISMTNRNDSGPDIEYIIDHELSNNSSKDRTNTTKNTSLYRLFLKPLIDERLLSHGTCDFNLDLVSESRQRKVITVLSLDYVPDRFKIFVMGFFLRKINDLLLGDKISKKNIAFFREVSEFMRLPTSGSSNLDPSQCFKILLNDLIRYGRNGLHFMMDTQSPAEVKNLVDGQEDFLCINQMTSQNDREMLCSKLISDGKMTRSQERALSMLKRHEICIVGNSEPAVILKRIAPPRSAYWKEDKGNFYTRWQKESGNYSDVSGNIEDIEDIYKIRQERIDLKILEEKAKHKPKQKEDKVKEITSNTPEQMEDTFEEVQMEYNPESSSKPESEYLDQDISEILAEAKNL